jgi:hypothetical protein
MQLRDQLKNLVKHVADLQSATSNIKEVTNETSPTNTEQPSVKR